ncbi:hypothetical protein FS749_006375 [Ceratobasidium sp. UAMH 11750]|nr:hypothetical protein FS749_006375 [Ceratobasidium sp. UAMH 11750]
MVNQMPQELQQEAGGDMIQQTTTSEEPSGIPTLAPWAEPLNENMGEGDSMTGDGVTAGIPASIVPPDHLLPLSELLPDLDFSEAEPQSSRNAKIVATLRESGNSRYRQYQQDGELEGLNLAIQCYTRAIPLTSDDHGEKPTILFKLGLFHHERFERMGRLCDVQIVIQCLTQAISLAPTGHPAKLACYRSLGNAYLALYEHTGRLPDLDGALEHHHQAISLTPDGSPDMAYGLSNLGNSYHSRFERLQQPDDLDTAIKFHNQAVSLIPDEDPDKPSCLTNLGVSYSTRYDCLGDLLDLEASIKFHEQAANLTPDGHWIKIACLNNLGHSYFVRYRHLGKLADLDAAITNQNQTVVQTPYGHMDRPRWLNSLGNSYEIRFERLGQLSDLDMAINCKQQAVASTSHDHPGWPERLVSLGNSYRARYESRGEFSDIDKAVLLQTDAMVRLHDDDLFKPACLSHLGISHHRRYEHAGNLEDFDLSTDYLHQAASITPADHPDKPMRLSNLGSIYRSRYQRLGDLADLDLAIASMESAIAHIPDGHADKLAVLDSLGRTLVERINRTNDAADIARSVHIFRQAAQSSAGSPLQRIKAAHQWAKQCSRSEHQSPLEAYQYFMTLIPQVIWLGSAQDNRYDEVANIAYVVLEGATVAIALQAYNRALEWLEQGRSIVWNQLLQLRSPFDQLSVVDPSFAEELKDVANQLEGAAALNSSSSEENPGSSSLEHAAQRHRRLAEQWEQLVHRAQSLPGMNSFLVPKDSFKLVAAAQAGAVVVVIVHRSSCSALVVTPEASDVGCIPLGTLSYDKVAEAFDQFLNQRHGRSRAKRKFTKDKKSKDDYGQVLRMLWVDIAKPVLDFLGYTAALPASDLPHITWCTTGPLSFLPLHAAGDYSKTHCSLFDYAVSSYTPTLSALLASPREPATFSGIAMVGQAFTAGFSSLPGTRRELEKIGDQAKRIQHTQLDGKNATRSAVLQAMEKNSWIHLACHASQDAERPMASAFHLHDGPLDLATITKKQLRHADLAFLSACQTATGDKQLSEEALHLAAGMIMAGFRTVVATMWPIADGDAPLVAEKFYEYMLKDGLPDTKKAARALHHAVKCLREDVGVEKYSRWAPYIHIGL